MRALLILLIMVNALNAAQVLAVLEMVQKDSVDVISTNEMQQLTDELRKNAMQILSQKEFSVLTRDSIMELLPSNEEKADCLTDSCTVDIGRVIGVEYVAQGSIGKFGDEYRLSIELYETIDSKLLDSIVIESADIEGLLAAIGEHSPSLFEKMLPAAPNPEITV